MLGIIIQARTGSTRLPGKMLMNFYEGDSLIDTILKRLKGFDPDARIILATTTNPKDDELVKAAEKQEVDCFRGDEENVLQRFIDTAEHFGITKLIRVCADNPFLDRSFLNAVIEKNNDMDYCSFFMDKETPVIKTHFGFFTEYVSLPALKKVRSSTTEKLYLEHVTNYMYSHPDEFTINRLPVPDYIAQNRFVRLTIDTKGDFDLCKTIYAYFCKNGIDPTAQNVIDHVKEKKEYVQSMLDQIKLNGK